MDDRIRDILNAHAGLTTPSSRLADDSDLYGAGMTSNASVNVMLALEDGFEIEFPDSMLKRSVFESIAAIRAAITELQGTPA
jgi:acyl carrier protein